MADTSLPQAGVGTGTTTTATLIALLTNCSGLLPAEYQEIWKSMIPYVSPFIGWVLIWLYNRFVEPADMAKVKGKLKRDIRYLKKCLKDKNLSDQAKAELRLDYDDTQKKLARLGRDYSSGIYTSTTPPANP